MRNLNKLPATKTIATEDTESETDLVQLRPKTTSNTINNEQQRNQNTALVSVGLLSINLHSINHLIELTFHYSQDSEMVFIRGNLENITPLRDASGILINFDCSKQKSLSDRLSF
jgi:hypothetical protein